MQLICVNPCKASIMLQLFSFSFCESKSIFGVHSQPFHFINTEFIQHFRWAMVVLTLQYVELRSCLFMKIKLLTSIISELKI